MQFTDPRDNETYEIVDGRAIVAFREYPVPPEMDPDYFDDPEGAGVATWHQTFTYPATRTTDLDVAAWLAAENLTVYSEWPEVGGIAVELPAGTTVLDAVTDWPVQYPNLIAVVDPDVINKGGAWPQTAPNDESWAGQWAINPALSAHHVSIQPVWQQNDAKSFGAASRIIAILDTGVDYNTTHLRDLSKNSTPKGCNVYDRRAGTTFAYRSQRGGRPVQWLLDESAANAEALGHGTSVASVASAHINNDSAGTPLDDRDVAGISHNNAYFPVAMNGNIPLANPS